MISSKNFTETGSPAIAMQWFSDFCKPNHVLGHCWAPSRTETGSDTLQVAQEVAILSGDLPCWLTDQGWRRCCVAKKVQARVQQ